MPEETGPYAWNKPRVYNDEQQSEAKAANGTLTAEMASPWLEEGVMWSAGNATCLLHLGRPPHLNCSKLEAGELFRIVEAVEPNIDEVFDDPRLSLPGVDWLAIWRRAGRALPNHLSDEQVAENSPERLHHWIALLTRALMEEDGTATKERAHQIIEGYMSRHELELRGFGLSSFYDILKDSEKELEKLCRKYGVSVPK
jgi:hypothetical protein